MLLVILERCEESSFYVCLLSNGLLAPSGGNGRSPFIDICLAGLEEVILVQQPLFDDLYLDLFRDPMFWCGGFAELIISCSILEIEFFTFYKTSWSICVVRRGLNYLNQRGVVC